MKAMVLMTLEIPMHAATLVIMANPEYGTCKKTLQVTVPFALSKACPRQSVTNLKNAIHWCIFDLAKAF